MLSENLESVGWYMRSVYAIEHIKRNKHNPNYLSSAELHPNQLKLSNDINETVASNDILIFAIPSAFLKMELEKLTVSLENKTIFSAIKGIVPETGLIVGEHFQQEYNVPIENSGVISGRSHAEEVAMERWSY